AALHERLADQRMTLAKLRKLAGLMSQSEALKDLVGDAEVPSDEPSKASSDKAPAKTQPDPDKKRSQRKPSPPPAIDERCHHHHASLNKGDR
ncbi:MAG: hypothetical protein ACFCBW_15590, partial [Candidatus Competibacterales bacterium]